jgi:hypothetical protein
MEDGIGQKTVKEQCVEGEKQGHEGSNPFRTLKR